MLLVHRYLFSTFAFLLLLFPFSPIAEPTPDVNPALFGTEQPLEMTLSMDIKAVVRDKSEEPAYQPASLVYKDAEGNPVQMDVRVRNRGNFRLHRLNCDIPPIRLNFKPAKKKNTLFSSQKNIKLVTHCKDKKGDYEQRVLLEYLIYKMYNALTDDSFRVRLVHLTYEDTGGNKEPFTRHAFMIEHKNRLSERRENQLLENGVFGPRQMDLQSYTRMSVFQYMIGNTDWILSQRHNLVLLYKSGRLPIPVPYDFDWAGFIDAPYASPDPKLGILSVRERRYMAICETEQAFEPVFTAFNEQRPTFEALIDNLGSLNEKQTKKARQYIASFYKTINNPKDVEREFKKKCL